jgi:hypothetical protein
MNKIVYSFQIVSEGIVGRKKNQKNMFNLIHPFGLFNKIKLTLAF